MAKQDPKKQKITGRPLDPTRNAEDLMGDTSGIYGITRGSDPLTSAEPNEIPKDTSYFRGGVLDRATSHGESIPKEAISQKEYKKKVIATMSQKKADAAEDIASENDIAGDDGIGLDQLEEVDQIEVASTVEDAQQRTDYGEEDISGTNPAPESDDDMLAAAQNVGTQLDEDEEHPQELDIARDIDSAEEAIRTK